MPQKIVAGNWKMNLTHEEAVNLTSQVLSLVGDQQPEGVRLIFAPPFVHMGAVRYLLGEKEYMSVAAQDCSAHEKGAFTGEVSAAMIRSVGAQYVILGHSERRRYFSEEGRVLREKLARVLEAKLIPIFCCGESKEERESGNHFKTVEAQLHDCIMDLPDPGFQKAIIAYEPVWAIGTGLTASPQQAQEMHQRIRELLKAKFGNLAENTSLLYGGSCNEKNARELFSQPDIDGGLIGGASLKAESFVQIARSF